MKEIPLTQGRVALVSDCDFDYLIQWKWHARKSRKCWYAGRTIRDGSKYRCIYLHRVVADRAGLFGSLIDHCDRDGLNNQRMNLRIVTDSKSMFNRNLFVNNTSGVTGVCWNKYANRWEARIDKDRKVYCKRL